MDGKPLSCLTVSNWTFTLEVHTSPTVEEEEKGIFSLSLSLSLEVDEHPNAKRA